MDAFLCPVFQEGLQINLRIKVYHNLVKSYRRFEKISDKNNNKIPLRLIDMLLK